MKLLTFLGVGKYEETAYVWGEAEHTTRFAPAASCHFLKPASVVTFLTEDAQQQVFNDFRNSLPAHVEVIPQPIPLGSNQQQLWQIFQSVTAAVKAGDEVAFDITHGLRSFPLIGLLVAAFLRSGVNASIKHVLYGAFDVRDKSVQPSRTPMFDLTPMLVLLEWAGAADRFAQTGDARPMARLFAADRQPSRVVRQAMDTLTDVSLGALLCQPFNLARSAKQLGRDLQNAQKELSQTALPFDLLRQRVTGTFDAFTADADEDSSKVLKSQLKLIEWYFQNNQFVQAMTLAREWMINAVIFRLGDAFTLKVGEREDVYARAITGVERAARPDDSAAIADLNDAGRRIWEEWSEEERRNLIELSRGIQAVRNTLAHAGHQENVMVPRKISAKAEQSVLAPVRRLAAMWGVS